MGVGLTRRDGWDGGVNLLGLSSVLLGLDLVAVEAEREGRGWWEALRCSDNERNVCGDGRRIVGPRGSTNLGIDVDAIMVLALGRNVAETNSKESSR